MDLYTFNSVIDSMYLPRKTVTGLFLMILALPGVNVVVRGTKSSAQTNFNGATIKAKTGDVLVFSFVGMAESTTKVGSSSTINKMQSGVNLNEVVVVGYGTTSQALQELLNKLKLRFWSVKRYKYFSSTSR
jgi:hypothetical protein